MVEEKKITHKERHMLPTLGHGVFELCNFMKQSSVHLEHGLSITFGQPLLEQTYMRNL